MQKTALVAALACITFTLSACSDQLPTLDIKKPQSTSESATVKNLFPNHSFDNLIVACPETTSSDLTSLIGTSWPDAPKALPANDSTQGLVLVSGEKVVAAGVNKRTDVDFCLGSFDGPVKITSESELKGSQVKDTWTVTWPKA